MTGQNRTRLRLEDKPLDLMLDSGAFGAWNRGVKIDLDAYIDFITEHKEVLSSYVALDVLAEGRESQRTSSAIEQAAILSYKNLQIMKDAGLSPIPVFHQGDGFKWLERLLKDGETYIGISTRKDLLSGQTRPWLDKVWSYLRDAKGHALIKTHGFGITSPKLLFSYPWYTTDSTTWMLSAAFGKIAIPRLVGASWHPKDQKWYGGEWDYMSPPRDIVTSHVEQSSKAANDRQFASHGPMVQAIVVRWLEEEAKLCITEVRNFPISRFCANLIYFMKLANAITASRKDGTKLKIMFASDLSRMPLDALQQASSFTRLLSYAELLKAAPGVFENYMKTGRLADKKRNRRAIRWNQEIYTNFRRRTLFDRIGGYGSMIDDVDTSTM